MMDWRERTTAAALLLRGENSCMWTREVRNSCRTAACMEVVVMLVLCEWVHWVVCMERLTVWEVFLVEG